jgi:hypothetical protein
MENQTEKGKLKEQLKEEIARWQTKMDETKLQLHLGAKEAQDKIDPYVKELELKYEQAMKKWEEIDEASENAWEDIQEGLQSSFKSMSEAFNKAKQHFKDDEKQ